MNLICVGDGDIPVLMEMASGNQSDKARFAGLLGEFRQQWTFEGLCIADGALYSADNIKVMNDLQWLTRVPLSIKEASTWVNEIVELKPSTVEGYKLKESSSEYEAVPQRWILIESEQRRKSDGMIMSLCLLVYNLGQRQLRQALAGQAKTIPDQLGKPTSTPTLRWVFQCFMAVHLVFFSRCSTGYKFND